MAFSAFQPHPEGPGGQPVAVTPLPTGTLSSTQSLFPSFDKLPKVIWRFNPDVTLKLRKNTYPLGLTRLTLGADYSLRTQHFAFKWAWRDRIIGGRLEFDGDQIALAKCFDIDKSTKLDVRAAFDFRARKALFSMNIKAFQGIFAHDRPNGLRIKRNISLDERLTVEVQGNLSVPEARISTGTNSAVSLGDGNFEFDLEQVNVRFLLK